MKTKGILYAIVDRSLGDDKIIEALRAGVDMMQLREKNVTAARYLEDARWLREQTRLYKTVLLINDRVDIALACGADGVHLGQEDIPVMEARRLAARLGLGDFLVGATARTTEQAVRSLEQGADYIGSGAWFPTDTKPDAALIRDETYREILRIAPVPNVAIGGITPENCLRPLQIGASGLAVSGGIFHGPSVTAAVERFREILNHTAM